MLQGGKLLCSSVAVFPRCCTVNKRHTQPQWYNGCLWQCPLAFSHILSILLTTPQHVDGSSHIIVSTSACPTFTMEHAANHSFTALGVGPESTAGDRKEERWTKQTLQTQKGPFSGFKLQKPTLNNFTVLVTVRYTLSSPVLTRTC